MTFQEALEIMKKHNETGASVLNLTNNRYYENQVLRVLLQGCEQLIQNNEQCKDVLKKAVDDIATLGSFGSVIAGNHANTIIDLRTHRWRFEDLAKPLLEEHDPDSYRFSVRL